MEALSTRIPSHHRSLPSPFPFLPLRGRITAPHCTKMRLIPYPTTTSSFPSSSLPLPSFPSPSFSFSSLPFPSLSAQCHPPTSYYLYCPFLFSLSLPFLHVFSLFLRDHVQNTKLHGWLNTHFLSLISSMFVAFLRVFHSFIHSFNL